MRRRPEEQVAKVRRKILLTRYCCKKYKKLKEEKMQ